MNRSIPQTYENHRSFDGLHIAATLSLLPALAAALVAFWPGLSASATLLLLKALALYFVLCLMAVLYKVRRYPLAMQDRIIRLEMQLRLQRLLPPDEHWQIQGLTMDQIIALHYASDEELPELVRRTLDENITKRDKIKRLIKYWTPDYDRI